MAKKPSKTVLVTGSQGFIGGYLCRDLLERGYRVIGVDNFSKYGPLQREHDSHKNFKLLRADISRMLPIFNSFVDVDYVIAGAAMIGGISYFHKYAYDLLATNERIMANTFDTAINLWRNGRLNRLVVISSSMVYEGADLFNSFEGFSRDSPAPWPTKEGCETMFPPPTSTYGFQKLSCEYFCKGANQQYGLPYTIVRPFNCVGLGEEEAIGEAEVMSGNVKLQMSHVLPDLVNKCLRGQDPLRILGDGSQVRCYTHGKDIARGIIMAMESDAGLNEDFNIASDRPTTVLELAEMVWSRVNPGKPFVYESDEPFAHDVQKRIPDVEKAKRLLGFESKISLERSVAEVVRHMKGQYASNRA